MELVTTIDDEFLKEDSHDIIMSDSKVSSDSHKFFSTIDFMTGITAKEGSLRILILPAWTILKRSF